MKIRVAREDEFLPKELRFLELMQARALHRLRKARAAMIAAKGQREWYIADAESRIAWGEFLAYARAVVVYLEQTMEDK